jgi:hypothetical protein
MPALNAKDNKFHLEILIFTSECKKYEKSHFSVYLYIPFQVSVTAPSQEQKHLAHLHIPSQFYDKVVGEAHAPTLYNLTHCQMPLLHMK